MGFLSELRRRNVFKVGIAYLMIAWLLAQVGALSFQAFAAPGWVLKSFILLLAFGFPLALFFAWAYELTPRGLVPTRNVPQHESITLSTGRKLDFLIIALLLLVVIYLVVERTTTTAATRFSETRSIAVLPFVNMSDNQGTQSFADGLHDDILTRLSRIKGLRTISRTTMNRYASTELSVPEIGVELGVENILEGAVQRAGNRVRVNVQLIDVASDAHLWAETYDGELTVENLFAIQAEIAAAVAAELKLRFPNQDRSLRSSVPTHSMAAYDAYMLGKLRMDDRTVAGLKAAKSHFRQALELDPDFAEAHAALSGTLLLEQHYTAGVISDTLRQEAQSHIDMALRLKPDLPEAWMTSAYLKLRFDEYAESLPDFERAIAMDPNNARARHWYALALTMLSRDDEALVQLDIAAELDPFDANLRVEKARILQKLYQFELANQEIAAAKKLAKGRGAQIWFLVSHEIYAECRHDEALRLINTWSREDAASPAPLVYGAFAFVALGKPGEIEAWLDALKETDAASSLIHHIEYWIARYDNRLAELEEHAVALMANPGYVVNISDIVNDYTLLTGDTDAAIALFKRDAPELFLSPPAVDENNYELAIDLAAVLQLAGEHSDANILLSAAKPIAGNRSRIDSWGYGRGVALVKILLLEGNRDAALQELKLATEAAACGYFLMLDHDLAFAKVRDDPDFREIADEMRERYRQQLDTARANGWNLPPAR